MSCNGAPMFQVGDKFHSFEHFTTKLKEYENIVYNKYWMRDCRTLKIQSRRFPESVAARANIDLKYYYCRISCIKGGRQHVPKNVKRQTLTFKQGCQSGMYIKLSPCGNYLVLNQLNEEHNHTISKHLFDTLPHQRLNLPAEIKSSSQQALLAGGNKKIIQQQIKEQTGCLITLKDLSNLNRKPEPKKGFAECVDILKDVYNCEVHVLCDKDENMLCLFFQDVEMKSMFAAYPEIIFVDGTYGLHESTAATFIVMVEDAEGNRAVVAACMLSNENEETIDWFVKQFKGANSLTSEIKVIMSDKDSKERTAFKKNFPNASFQICLFHTMQIFNRDVSPSNLNITPAECETAKQYLTKLAFAKSEQTYEEELEHMKDSVPKIVADYFERIWHPIRDQWVLYLTFNNKSFLNKTNNKLECINQKLKSVIYRFSDLEDFIKHFFICVNTDRVERNMRKSVQSHKVSTNMFTEDSDEYLYQKYLSNYAFEKVKQQISNIKEVTNLHMIEIDHYLAPTAEGLLEVSSKSCECLFWTSMGLPCKHILKCRGQMGLPLFDADICLKRWTRSYFESTHPLITEFDGLINKDNKDFKNSRSKSICKKRALTNHQKFKLMNEECLKLSQACAEVPTNIFYKRLTFVQNIIENWSSFENNVTEENEETDMLC